MRLKDRVKRLEKEMKITDNPLVIYQATLNDNVQVLINKIRALEEYLGITDKFIPPTNCSLRYEKIKPKKESKHDR